MIGGCDPGKNGCLSWIDDQDVMGCLRFKGAKLYDLREDLWELRISGLKKVYFETVNSRPDDDPYSAFQFGRNTGNIEGMLWQCGMELVYIQKWQLEFGLGGIKDYAERKRQAKRVAQELFPEIKITLDMADAILIAVYGWRKENGVLTHGRKKDFVSKPGTGVAYTKRSTG